VRATCPSRPSQAASTTTVSTAEREWMGTRMDPG
jgi:hypothetical protein